MKNEIRETIQMAAQTHGASFESISDYLSDVKKMSSFRSPCAGCLDALPPSCRKTCGTLSTFRAVMELHEDHTSPSTVVATTFGDIKVSLRKSTILASLSHSGMVESAASC